MLKHFVGPGFPAQFSSPPSPSLLQRSTCTGSWSGARRRKRWTPWTSPATGASSVPSLASTAVRGPQRGIGGGERGGVLLGLTDAPPHHSDDRDDRSRLPR